MNALALSLLGLRPLPGLPPAPGRKNIFPPVSHDLFAMNLRVGPAMERKRLKRMKLDGIVSYLRDNGAMSISDLGEVFGVSPESMTNDIHQLQEEGRVRRVLNSKPAKWEAK